MSFTWLEPAALQALLKGPQRCSALVLDVRDEDYEGGHIRGCVNFPVDHFDDDNWKQQVDGFIHHWMTPLHPSLVVVHCYLCQQRGPFCAKRLASRLQCLEMEEPRVCVLRGGFMEFKKLYGGDTDLIEDNDEGGEYCSCKAAAAPALRPEDSASVLPPEACCLGPAAPLPQQQPARLPKVLELDGEAIIRGPGRCCGAAPPPAASVSPAAIQACCYPSPSRPEWDAVIWGY